MIIPIAHRINSLEDSKYLPKTIGIEFDVHSYGQDLIVSHDAFTKGDNLKKFLEFNKDRVCAINIKEEGIEEEVIKLSLNAGLERFFLFDVSFPQIFRLGSKYHNHFCLRVSEFEKPMLKELRNFSSFLWVDSFKGKFWMSDEEIIYIKKLKYNLCFVSPELHEPNIKRQIDFSKMVKKKVAFFDDKDSICTKDYKMYSTYW